jgi:glycosyltransferase involved in cell wall biosynthesis
MKVVHVSTLYHPFAGGLEIAVQRIAEEQRNLMNNVFIATSNFTGFLESTDRINGVAVIRVKVLRSRYPYLIYPMEIPRILLEKADIIHGWSHNYLFVYKLIRYAKKVLNKPIVVYFIGIDYLKKHYNPFIRFIGYPYQKIITKLFINTIDLALVTNNYEKKILKEKYSIESIVIPH